LLTVLAVTEQIVGLSPEEDAIWGMRPFEVDVGVGMRPFRWVALILDFNYWDYLKDTSQGTLDPLELFLPSQLCRILRCTIFRHLQS